MNRRTNAAGKYAKLVAAIASLLLVGVFVSAGLADGGSAPAPTVATDQAAYAPGDAVHVTGAGWLPGENVHVHAAANSQPFSYDSDVLAGADGSIDASFVLPSDYADTFAVAASGALQGSVSTSFSDAFAASGTAAPPTIVSDQNDYAPGSTVTLTGAGWAPGESVHLTVNDTVGQTWKYDGDVVADSSGAFTAHVTLANYFVSDYDVTATGAGGEVATTKFTDSVNTTTTLASTPNPSNLGQSVTFTATITCATSCTFSASTVDFVENANNGCNGGTTLGSTSTLTGSGLSRQATFSTSSLSAGAHSIRACFNPSTTSGNNAQKSVSDPALSQVVNNACTAPSVSTQPGDASITYGANATFTSSATGSPAPTVQWQVSTNGGSSFSNIPGATSSTFTLTKPGVSLSGSEYRAVFTNGCGSANSNAATLTVSKLNLTITGAVANNKVYDGNASATVDFTGASLVGAVSGDSVSINSSGYSAGFANKNVANGKPVTVSGVVLAGGDAGNYTVSQPTGLTANVTAAPLDLSAVGDTKQYDGGVGSAGTPTVGAGQLQGTDTVDGLVQRFQSKNVLGPGNSTLEVSAYVIHDGNSGGNYSVTTHTHSGTITAAPLDLSAVGDTKQYDGGVGSAGTPTVGAGQLQGTDTVDGLVQRFQSKNVLGPGNSTLEVSAYVIHDGNSGGNYSVTTHTHSGTITAAPLDLSAVGDTKQYDGGVGSAGTPTVGAGQLQGTDTVDGLVQRFQSKNVLGPGNSTLEVSAYVIHDGNSGGNYSVTTHTHSGTITAAPLDLSAVGDTKQYDGGVGSAGTPTVGAGQLQGTDTVDGLVQRFQSKNVLGPGNSTLEVSAYVIHDGNSGGNYSVTTHTHSGTITAAPLDLSAVGDTKQYDGGVGSAGTPTVGAGQLQGTDTVDGLVQRFQSKNVLGPGNSTLEVSAYVIHDGNSGGNYSVTTHTHSGTITAAPLDLSAVGDTKQYDGGVGSAGTPTVGAGQLQGTDTVDGLVQRFQSKNVLGPGNSTLEVSAYVIHDGNSGGNYSVTTHTHSGTITAAPLDLSAVGDTKQYDGGVGSAGTPTVGAGQLQGTDTVDGLVQRFQSKNVLGPGNSTLEVSAYVIHDGNSGGNYSVTTHTHSGTITAAPLDLSAVGDTKQYDGGVGSAGTPTVGAGQLQGTDTVDGLVQRFQSKNVLGPGNSTLEVSAYVIHDGNSGGNYSVTTHTHSGTITAAPLDLSAVGDTKQYDGGVGSAGTPTVGAGQLQGTDTVDGLVQRFQSKNVLGPGNSTLEVSAYVIHDGNSGGNYSVTTHTHSGTITAAPLTVTANDQTMILNGVVPTLSYVITGFISTETLASSGVTGSASCTTSDGKTVGAFPIVCTAGSLTAQNYGFPAANFVNGKLTVGYRLDGYLQPINDTAHTGLVESKFKLGQTIPAKFQLKDALGNVVQQVGNPTFSKTFVGNCGQAVADTADPVTPDPGSAFTWDGSQYHFNWSTKGLNGGEYRITATLADAEKVSVNICLS